MAQTTSGYSFHECHVDFSTDGASWTAVSGHLVSVAVSGGELITGVVHTSDGNTPILTASKNNPIVVTVSVVHTETADEPWDMAADAYDAKSQLYVRWSPAGGDASDLGYTSTAGYVTNFVFPGGDVAAGEAIVQAVEFTVPSVTRAAIGTAGW